MIGRDLDAREGAGLQTTVRIRDFPFDGERARLQADGGAHAHDPSVHHLSRKRVDPQRDLAAGLDPRRELLRDFRRDLERVQPHDPHDGRLRLHELAERNEPLRHIAFERRPHGGIAHLALREAKRRPLGLDVGAQLARRREGLLVRGARGIDARLRRVEIGLRQQLARGQALRPIEALLRVRQLRRGAHDLGHAFERGQLAGTGCAVAGARLVERSALGVGAIPQLFLVELDERRTGRHAIA